MKFIAESSKEGKLSLRNEHERERFSKFLMANKGIRLSIEPVTPESRKQRGFFEGAIVPLYAYHQEGIDHRNPDDLRKVREWLKVEFNSEMVVVKGKVHRIGGSTKGSLNRGFIERVMDDMAENGYSPELLNPAEYRKWKEEVFPYGGAGNYIDHLADRGLLRNKEI